MVVYRARLSGKSWNLEVLKVGTLQFGLYKRILAQMSQNNCCFLSSFWLTYRENSKLRILLMYFGKEINSASSWKIVNDIEKVWKFTGFQIV